MATRRKPRGVTLLELMVVVAIIGIMATLAYTSYLHDLPRARLASTTTDLQALIQSARQKALSSGHDVAVLFYPSQITGRGVGRVVVYLDGTGGFMNGTPQPGDPSFCTFNPVTMATRSPPHDIPDSLDFPNLVAIAPVAQPATLAAQMTFPYNALPVPGAGCSFCDAALTRGAIRFDQKGNATFYSTCSPAPLAVQGGSISLTSTDLAGSRVLVVTPYGNVRVFNAE